MSTEQTSTGGKRKINSGFGNVSSIEPDRIVAENLANKTKTQTTNNESTSLPSTSKIVRENSPPVETKTSKPKPVDTTDIELTTVTPIKKRKGRVGMERKYEDITRTSLVLPTEVHDKLQEIVFANRKTTKQSFNDVVMGCIDAMLKKDHKTSISKLVAESDQS